MKKICNFRPLCWLALIVMSTVAATLWRWWLGLIVGVVLLFILGLVRVPRAFKVVAGVLYVLTILSCVLTTALSANPTVHTYDPDAGLRGVILRYARWYLLHFLSVDHTNLLMAMMFGLKTGLSAAVRNNFAIAGMAHVLTVSGLHVGLIVAVISQLWRWYHWPRPWQLYFTLPLLLFYAYLCGWQYAILRAVIMYTVYAFAKNHVHIADSLTALSAAAIVILVLFPYALLSASFWLSFTCLLGIGLLYQPCSRWCPVRSIALYLAVNIATFPVVLYFFGRVSLYGLLANVVLVPLLVMAFYLGMFAIITFIFGLVLFVAALLLDLVCWVAAAIPALPWATIALTGTWPAMLLYLGALILASRFIFLKPQVKYPIVLMLFACYFVLIMV